MSDGRPSPRRGGGVTYGVVRRLALALPGVEESTSYGTPSLKVKGKFLLRLREDGESLAVRVQFPVREALLQEQPEMFFLTDHYLEYPAILVRLSRVDRRSLRRVLDHAWRTVAPPRLVRESDAPGGSVGRTAGARRSSGRPRRRKG